MSYLRRIALATWAGIFAICTYNILPNLTPKVETEVQRTLTGVKITRTEYERFSISSSRTIVADYDATKNQLDIQVMSRGKQSVRFCDEVNDGLVNAVLTGDGRYERQGNEADFQAKVDSQFSGYKGLLNVEEIVKKEMAKPTPSVASSLENL